MAEEQKEYSDGAFLTWFEEAKGKLTARVEYIVQRDFDAENTRDAVAYLKAAVDRLSRCIGSLRFAVQAKNKARGASGKVIPPAAAPAPATAAAGKEA